MPDALIELEDVWLQYNGVPVLEGVNFAIYPGEFIALIGPNGGGKTTLLKIILGLIQPTRGTVRVFGGVSQENRDQLGYVPQTRTFDFQYPITVMEMVLSGRLGHIHRHIKRYSAGDFADAKEALRTMGIDDLAAREIQDLSGGEQQRAIIARALVGNPRVLLLDEPTVYIDTPTENRFYDILDRLKERMTIVLVTHDIGVISSHVTRVACLNRRLYSHGSNEITGEMIRGAYQCPVDLIAHGVPHRVLHEHEEE